MAAGRTGPRTNDSDPSTGRNSSIDQGWAWAVMLACCLWNFIIAGTLKTFGVIYLELMEVYGKSPAETAWVGFAFSFMAMILSPISGYISDHHPIQSWTFICGAISGLGMASVGLVTDLPGTIWTYGILVGTMTGIMDSPFLGMFSKYFHKRRSLANGVAFAGSSLGCLVLPLMLRWSIDAYTFRGAMFFMGGVWMHSCVVAAVMCPLPARDRHSTTLVVRIEGPDLKLGAQLEGKDDDCTALSNETSPSAVNSRSSDDAAPFANTTGPTEEIMLCNQDVDHDDSQRQTSPASDGSVLIQRRAHFSSAKQSMEKPAARDQASGCKSCCSLVRSVLLDYADFLSNPELLRFTGVLVFGGFAYFNQLVFFPAYAKEIGLSKFDGALVVSIAGISELIGRPCVGYLGNHFDKTMLCFITSAVSCIAGLVIYMFPHREVLMSYSAVFGLTGGTSCALGIPILSEAAGPERIGSAAGLFPLALGLGSAVGPPLLGYIKELSGLYVNSLRLAALMYLPACLLLTCNLRCAGLRRCRSTASLKKAEKCDESA